MDIIFTEKACPPKGHYHQAVRHNGILYISGILGITPDGKPVTTGMIGEAEQILNNLSAILEAGGSAPNKVLKVTIYISDLDDAAEFNKIYSKFFGEHKCARSFIQVKKLSYGLHLEIDAIAISE